MPTTTLAIRDGLIERLCNDAPIRAGVRRAWQSRRLLRSKVVGEGRDESELAQSEVAHHPRDGADVAGVVRADQHDAGVAQHHCHPLQPQDVGHRVPPGRAIREELGREQGAASVAVAAVALVDQLQRLAQAR